MQRFDTFLDDFLVRHITRGDGEIGTLIDRLALIDQPPDGGSGVGGLQQWAVGPALDPAQKFSRSLRWSR